MHAFAELLDRLFYMDDNRAKTVLLHDYFRNVPDPDRGWAVAALAGALNFNLFKRSLIRELITQRVDPVLFAMSHDYVGDIAETAAHLWPALVDGQAAGRLPSLNEIITEFRQLSEPDACIYLVDLLNASNAKQRWALLKLGTQGLRVGVSAQFMKSVLADYGKVAMSDVEEVWHGLTPPYAELFNWLEGRVQKPDVSQKIVFHPVMLSNPLEDAQLAGISPESFQAEWKFDGIRVQLVSLKAGQALFSRKGDDITALFPDLLEAVNFHAVLDGELVIRRNGQIASFNALQQRLNRKKPGARLISSSPAYLIIYDILRIGDEDLRPLPLSERRSRLEGWYDQARPTGMELSPIIPFAGAEQLAQLRSSAEKLGGAHIEGLMLKRRASVYIAGRPQGEWYKWRREARHVDAVLIYAERASGSSASHYSNYSFGLWQGDQLLPVGKAECAFTADGQCELNKWIDKNTINRFGPVRELRKTLVVEVAFDSVKSSPRHKAGLTLRFPSIRRVRWDKPADEADRLEVLRELIR